MMSVPARRLEVGDEVRVVDGRHERKAGTVMQDDGTNRPFKLSRISDWLKEDQMELHITPTD